MTRPAFSTATTGEIQLYDTGRPTVRAWITESALEVGVRIRNVEDCGNGTAYLRGVCYFDRDDWHRTRESAIARVEKMRTAAIKAAKRKLDKLTTMRVEVPR